MTIIKGIAATSRNRNIPTLKFFFPSQRFLGTTTLRCVTWGIIRWTLSSYVHMPRGARSRGKRKSLVQDVSHAPPTKLPKTNTNTFSSSRDKSEEPSAVSTSDSPKDQEHPEPPLDFWLKENEQCNPNLYNEPNMTNCFRSTITYSFRPSFSIQIILSQRTYAESICQF